MGLVAHTPWPSRLGLLPVSSKTLLWQAARFLALVFSWSWRCLTSGAGGSHPMAFTLGSLGFAGRLLWYGACLSSDRLGGSLYLQAFLGYQR